MAIFYRAVVSALFHVFTWGLRRHERHQHQEKRGRGVANAQTAPGGGYTKARQQKSKEEDATLD
jgi:hypothetical protein